MSDVTPPSTTTGPPRRRPATADVAGTAVMAVIGAVAVVMGLGYGFTRGPLVGPGFLPVTVGAFILLASLAEIARLYLERPGSGKGSLIDVAASVQQEATAATQHQQDPAEHRDTFGRTAGERNTAIVKVFAVIGLALLLIPVLGLLLSLAAMVLTVLVWIERKPVVPAALSTAGITLVAYLIFVQVLNVPVPQGALGLI